MRNFKNGLNLFLVSRNTDPNTNTSKSRTWFWLHKAWKIDYRHKYFKIIILKRKRTGGHVATTTTHGGDGKCKQMFV